MSKRENKIPLKDRPGFQKFKNVFPHIASKLANVIPIVGPGVSNMIDSIIDDTALNTTEAMQAKILLEQLNLKEFELEISDRTSARNRESEVAAVSKSWLTTNIVPLLAIFLIAIATGAIILTLAGKFTIVNQLSIVGITSLVNYASMVVAYYFGSSSGSKDKDTQLKSMMDKK